MTELESSHGLDVGRVLPIFFLVFVDVLGLTIILPLLHLYAAAFGATPLQIGLVAAAFPLAQLVGVPVMGALSDRYGRKPLLLLSQVTTCISFILLGLANSVAMIVLSRVVDGLFGANIATAQAALSDVTTQETRAQGLGVTGAAFGLGFIIGPVISLVALEFTDNLSIPAYIAACYSLVSILLTLFIFEETHPPGRRGQKTLRLAQTPLAFVWALRDARINGLLLLLFAQQVVFFGFESLLGLFTLSRLGLLGQGNALIFLLVGAVLVTVQARYIGRWTRRFGEARLATAALALLAVGLLLAALTPEQPHPFYVRRIVENSLRSQMPRSAEAVIGHIRVDLPDETSRGLGGYLWLLAAVAPVAVGAGLIRPSLNSLITRRVTAAEYGLALGASAAFVSAANATAPLLGATLFQMYGSAAPFLLGAAVMGILAAASRLALRRDY